MHPSKGGLALSPTDLANHLACSHLTYLDLEAAEGRLKRPRPPASLDVLFQRGDEHEAAFVRHLEASGRSVRTLGREHSVEDTRGALHSGVDVIVQAPLRAGRWGGYADVLLRVEEPSDLGAWSYEVLDTKLSSETKGGTVLQLCLYAELLAGLQGRMPTEVVVVSPGDPFTEERFRTDDFLAYHRLVKRRLEQAVADGGEARLGSTYPEPVEKCDACAWRWTCDGRRRGDDHLSLVAGIRRGQRKELVGRSVTTVAGLAGLPLPLQWRPERGATEAYERVREQARVQVEQRERGAPVHELLEPAEGRGLARLPEPSPGDVFLDFEGDRYVADKGIEYLFGITLLGAEGEDEYRWKWALDRAQERAAFEWLIDFLIERRERFPGAHVYHFGIYEPGALKRLMGRYGTRQDELDRLLRGEVLVDLHAVAKEGLRAGVERYSLKELEPFHGFTRALDLDEASAALRQVQRGLELGMPETIDAPTRQKVEQYNRDDCVSTRRLRDWLEGLRAELVARGAALARPVPKAEEPGEKTSERSAEARAIRDRLEAGLPADPEAWTPDERAQHLLGLLVEWHWREEKTAWWETFRLRALEGEDLVEERRAVGLIRYEGTVGKVKRSHLERFRFPPQELGLDVGTKLFDREGKNVGSVHALDEEAGWLDLKTTRKDLADVGDGLLEEIVVMAEAPEDALRRLAGWCADHGLDAPGPYRAARDLLLRRRPRRRAGSPQELRRAGESSLQAAIRVALELEEGLLAIQGPPGAGKTYTGARMIVALVQAGKRVGVTALSHKATRNLLEEVALAAREAGVTVRCGQRVREAWEPANDGIVDILSNPKVDEVLADGEIDVLGGTVWLWSRLVEGGTPPLDFLFVDEAGQLSLANTLAAAMAAHSVVLLGDPQQLEQPQKGAHPEGADRSALEHALTDDAGHRRETIPADMGLFLEETYRMHPAICGPLSELFYEGRLVPRPELAGVELLGCGPLDGAGFVFLPVEHEGATHRCDEEVAAIRGLLQNLLVPGARWRDRQGAVRPLTPADVLVVAPYNAQVAALRRALPDEIRVGTVDRFQGQEAPVVVYSLTASSVEDAPRGLDFLFSPNRLNVALSRARCRAILVASPKLLEPECRTPGQMRLANALCRVREVARET